MISVKTFSIRVDGCADFLLCARTAGKARARAWRLYREAYPEATFRRFLDRCYVLRVGNPAGVGERIIVAGEPATRVLPLSPSDSHVHFMRDGSDVVLRAHYSDVRRAAA